MVKRYIRSVASFARHGVGRLDLPGGQVSPIVLDPFLVSKRYASHDGPTPPSVTGTGAYESVAIFTSSSPFCVERTGHMEERMYGERATAKVHRNAEETRRETRNPSIVATDPPPPSAADAAAPRITPWSADAGGAKGFDYSRVRTLFKAQEVMETTLQQLVAAISNPAKHTRTASEENPDVSSVPSSFSVFSASPSVASTAVASPQPSKEERKSLDGSKGPPHVVESTHTAMKAVREKHHSPSDLHHSSPSRDGSSAEAKEEMCVERSSSSSSSSSPLVGLHPFFTRGIVFAHRDFDKALGRLMLHRMATAYTPPMPSPASHSRVSDAAFEPCPPPAYLYTGRGPSSAAMHLGHAIPFALTCYLQHALGLPTVIQVTDDEKYLFRDVSFCDDEAEERIRSNIKDIIAFGFDPKRTFIFRNTTYMGQLYPTVLALQRAMTAGSVRHTLGLRDADNVGKFSFAATQAAPCFATCFPHILLPTYTTPMTDAKRRQSFVVPQCIIPCAVDQDPFFVLARHASRRLPPSLMYHAMPWLRETHSPSTCKRTHDRAAVAGQPSVPPTLSCTTIPDPSLSSWMDAETNKSGVLTTELSATTASAREALLNTITGGHSTSLANPSEGRALIKDVPRASQHHQMASSAFSSATSSLVIPPPATLYTTFLPSLRGPSSKMSSSSQNAARDVIFLSDTSEMVKKKLRKAFSGGAPTLAAMKQGGDPRGQTGRGSPSSNGSGVDLEVDVAYQLLRFFMRKEGVWREVGLRYQRGEIHSGDVKALCALTLEKEFLSTWQARRAAVTDEDVEAFCRVRPIW